MKHFILSLIIALLPLTASLTTAAADTLVTPPAEGVAKTYYAMGYSYAHDDNRSYELRVVRQGEDIFIQGLYDRMPEAWVRGTMSGNKAIFPSGQYLGSVDPALVDDSHDVFDVYMYCSTDLRTTCDLEIDYNPLNDTFEAYYQYILFSEQDNIRARYEHLQNLSFFSAQKEPTAVPDDLATVSYRMNAYECSIGKDLEYYVQVGFRDDKVFVRGISEAFPEAWVSGTIEGDQVFFMRNQYLGPYVLGGKTYDIWFTGINHDEAYFTSVAFDYDPTTGIFTQPEGNWLVINGDPAAWKWLNNMSNVVLTPDENKQEEPDELTPSTPPAGLATTTFHVTGTDYSFDPGEGEPLTPYDVEIGFDGSNVYVKGLFTDMDEAWAKGRLDGTTLTFPASQYFGKWYDTMDCWMMGVQDHDTMCSIVFTYHPEEGAFVQEGDTEIYFNDDAHLISEMPLLAIGDLTLKGELPEGIASISAAPQHSAPRFFNAAGIATAPRAPGLYITAGRKVIVK